MKIADAIALMHAVARCTITCELYVSVHSFVWGACPAKLPVLGAAACMQSQVQHTTGPSLSIAACNV